MRKILSLILMLALVVGMFSLAAAPSPVKASSASLASIVPADLAIFAELNTSDIKGTVDSITGLLSKANPMITSDLVFQQLDQALSQSLGRTASFTKDIQPWLGDSIAFGFPISDAVLTARTSQQVQPRDLFVVAAVKDDAAAQSLVAEIATKGNLTSKPDTIGGSPATIYGSASFGLNIALWKGYLAVGTSSAITALIDNINKSGPMLGADPNYQKVMALLKPNNLLTAYIGSRLYKYDLHLAELMLTSSNTSGLNVLNVLQFDQQALDAIHGQAIALRSDGKILAFDLAQAVDPAAQQKLLAQLGVAAPPTIQPLSAKLADRIPAKALAVLIGSNLSGLYTYLRSAMPKFAQFIAGVMPAQTLRRSGITPLIAAIGTRSLFSVFEAALEETFDLDMQQDVLSWTDGEYALYMTFDKTGVFAPFGWPFDHTFLLDAANADKANAFAGKVANGLPRINQNITVSKPDNGIYTGLFGRLGIGFGVANNTFVLTSSSGLTDAVNATAGDGALSASSAWKNAMAAAPKGNQGILFLNLAEVSSTLKANLPPQALNDSSTQQVLSLLDQFESAVIYSAGYSDGTNFSTLDLILK